MEKIKGVYVRKDGRCQARYKKGVAENGRAIYGIVYGKTIEEVVEKRRAITGGDPDELRPASQMNLLILGYGSLGRMAREIAESLHIFQRIAFLDDEADSDEALVLGKCKDMLRFRSEFPCALVAVSDNKKRKKLAKVLKESNFLVPSLVSPDAHLIGNPTIGEGTIIMPQATVCDAKIGSFCIVAADALVSSDAVLGDYSYVDCKAIVPAGGSVPAQAYVQMGELYMAAELKAQQERQISEWKKKYREQFGRNPNLFDG